MRCICVILFIVLFQVIGKTQIEKEMPIRVTGDEFPIRIRGDKDDKITKRDSLLLKKFELDILSFNMPKINTIPSILNDCNISMSTKANLAKLLFKKSESIDPKLFKVIGESLFLTIYHIQNINAITNFIVLDQVYLKSNAVDFCIYVIENDLLNKCAIYSENCTYPRDECENFTRGERFLSLFAEMYKSQGIERLDSILNETTNNCVFYNLSRIKHYITNN